MDAILINNLTKIYSSKGKKVKAINNLTRKFKYGKFYLITGHSGSGKSTLLHLIGLIDKPTSGHIFIAGKYTNNLKHSELSILRNQHIGFVFQEFFLDRYLTAKENIMIPMLINSKYKTKKEILTKAEALLKEMGLEERSNHFPKELSGGECQRVAIARSLANDPQIILADEPTGNLDIKNEEYVFEKLKQMSKTGKCIIMVSHSKDARKYADEVLELKDGVWIEK